MSRHLLRPLALLALLLSALVLLPSASASAAGPPGPTRAQERLVLDAIDDLCGDTWCEGDYAFEFRDFSCDAKRASCRLRLRIGRLTGEEALRWHERSGEVRGFVRYEEMVETYPSGDVSLHEDFVVAVGDLIAEVEESVPADRCEGVGKDSPGLLYWICTMRPQLLALG